MTGFGSMIRDLMIAFWRIRNERAKERDEIRRSLLFNLYAYEWGRARDDLRDMREPPRREWCDSEAVYQSVEAQWRSAHGMENHAHNYRRTGRPVKTGPEAIR